ncbi:MAG: hypothetical protein GY931_04490 [Maribacter sp.]|nr:hypothetical protein [Maribacter sp.]
MNHDIGNVLIHIGFHKTGTTWCQNNLFNSGSKTFKPLSKRKKGQSTLAKKFIYGDDGYLLSPFNLNKESIQKELDETIKDTSSFKNKVPVMSHERLSGNPHSGGFDASKICSMLKNTFPNAKVLIVIREQKSFILSNYFQYLSIGGTNDLHKYLNAKYDGKRPGYSPNHINFLNIIQEYRGKFGPDNILVLPYEIFLQNPSKFISMLGSFLNKEIDINTNSFKNYANKKNNHFAMYHFRVLNIFRKSTSVNNNSSFSTEYTRWIFDRIFKIICLTCSNKLDRKLKKKLQVQIQNQIGTRYKQDNIQLSKLIGIDLCEYGYY